MRYVIFRNSAVLTVTALALLTLSCGGGTPVPPVNPTVQPSASATAATPATPSTSSTPFTSSTPSTGGGSSAEPAPGNAAGTDQATWLARANDFCQIAITQYQRSKERIAYDNPEGLAYAAALATRTASEQFDKMTAPTAEAERLAAQVHAYADGQLAVAVAMQSGSGEDPPFDELEAAGQELATTAQALGADACVAMTQEV